MVSGTMTSRTTFDCWPSARISSARCFSFSRARGAPRPAHARRSSSDRPAPRLTVSLPVRRGAARRGARPAPALRPAACRARWRAAAFFLFLLGLAGFGLPRLRRRRAGRSAAGASAVRRPATFTPSVLGLAAPLRPACCGASASCALRSSFWRRSAASSALARGRLRPPPCAGSSSSGRVRRSSSLRRVLQHLDAGRALVGGQRRMRRSAVDGGLDARISSAGTVVIRRRPRILRPTSRARRCASSSPRPRPSWCGHAGSSAAPGRRRPSS